MAERLSMIGAEGAADGLRGTYAKSRRVAAFRACGRDGLGHRGRWRLDLENDVVSAAFTGIVVGRSHEKERRLSEKLA